MLSGLGLHIPASQAQRCSSATAAQLSLLRTAYTQQRQWNEQKVKRCKGTLGPLMWSFSGAFFFSGLATGQRTISSLTILGIVMDGVELEYPYTPVQY